MGRWAVISEGGSVETVIVWDGIAPFSPCHPADRLVECAPQVSAGWTYTNDQFVEPEPVSEEA